MCENLEKEWQNYVPARKIKLLRLQLEQAKVLWWKTATWELKMKPENHRALKRQFEIWYNQRKYLYDLPTEAMAHWLIRWIINKNWILSTAISIKIKRACERRWRIKIIWDKYKITSEWKYIIKMLLLHSNRSENQKIYNLANEIKKKLVSNKIYL